MGSDSLVAEGCFTRSLGSRAAEAELCTGKVAAGQRLQQRLAGLWERVLQACLAAGKTSGQVFPYGSCEAIARLRALLTRKKYFLGACLGSEPAASCSEQEAVTTKLYIQLLAELLLLLM